MKTTLKSAFTILVLATLTSVSFADSNGGDHKFMLEDAKGFLNYDEPKKNFAYSKILIDKGLIVMEVLMPAWNLHGVDAAPSERSEEQKRQVEINTNNYAENPYQFFSFIPKDACALKSQAYNLEQASTTDKGQKTDAGSWRRFDIKAEMVFGCAESRPEKFQVDLFKAFPRIKEINAQMIVDDGELTKITLTPELPTIPIAK